MPPLPGPCSRPPHQSCQSRGCRCPRSPCWGCSPRPEPPAQPPAAVVAAGAARAGAYSTGAGSGQAASQERNPAVEWRHSSAHLRRYVLQLHGHHSLVRGLEAQRVALHALYPPHERHPLAHELPQLRGIHAGRGVADVQRRHDCCLLLGRGGGGRGRPAMRRRGCSNVGTRRGLGCDLQQQQAMWSAKQPRSGRQRLLRPSPAALGGRHAAPRGPAPVGATVCKPRLWEPLFARPSTVQGQFSSDR